jgi:hypothetical protein
LSHATTGLTSSIEGAIKSRICSVVHHLPGEKEISTNVIKFPF